MEDQVNAILQVLALELINQRYPHDQWIQAYTHGSAIDAIRNGESVVYMELLKVVVTATDLAVENLIQTKSRCKNDVILTNSVPTLQDIELNKAYISQ